MIVWHLPILNCFGVCRAASRGESSRSRTEASNQDQSDGNAKSDILAFNLAELPAVAALVSGRLLAGVFIRQ